MTKNIKEYFGKVTILIIGVIIMTFGGTILVIAEIGGDSILVFEQGFTFLIGLTMDDLGIGILIINVIFLILVFFIDRKMINIGTVLVVVLVGPFVKFIMEMNIIPVPTSFGFKVLLSFIGCLIASLGVSIYIYANVGYAPFEGLMIIVKNKLNCRFVYVKVIGDVILFLLGWLMGGVVGLGSLMTLVIFGPMIEVYTRLLLKNKNKKLKKASS
jgi:uncharacterized membrane protein YczE